MGGGLVGLALRLERVPWSDTAADVLQDACGDDLSLIAADVVSGSAALWRVPTGYVVTRVETFSSSAVRPVLVLVAGAGSDLHSVVGAFCDIADELGYDVRVHSSRKGMKRMLSPFGFNAVETVYIRKK